MSLQFLLDTNILSEPVGKPPNKKIIQLMNKHADEIAISTTVLHEMQYGIQRLPQSRRRTELEDYLTDVVESSIPILAYDHQAADWHALERARLSSIGLAPSFADGQIAAVAAVHELMVVTANVKHFEGYQGIEVVNWLEG